MITASGVQGTWKNYLVIEPIQVCLKYNFSCTDHIELDIPCSADANHLHQFQASNKVENPMNYMALRLLFCLLGNGN